MRKIPPKIRAKILLDPFYNTCARAHEGTCQSKKITIEHVIIFAGRQIDDLWNLIPLCEYHHDVNKFQDGGDLSKERNLWIALNRATEAEMMAISKAIPYTREKIRLNNKWGTYKQIYPSGVVTNPQGIAY